MGPGAFTGGRELDYDKLVRSLEARWLYPEEIADFVRRYWYSIKYAMSAQKRGSLCSFMALFMLVVAGWYYFLGLASWMWIWSIAAGLLLMPIGNRVNKALFILHHEAGTDEWDLACVSFVALAESTNNENYRYLVNEILPPEDVQRAIAKHRKITSSSEGVARSKGS
jgi:hypothetical protein